MPSAVKPFRNERANAIGSREPANDTDLELGDLTVKVSRHEALAEQFDTVHLCFDAAPAVIAAPSSPDCAAEAFGCTQGLVARECAGTVRLPRLGILAGRDDCGCATGGCCVMALSGVEGAVRCPLLGHAGMPEKGAVTLAIS